MKCSERFYDITELAFGRGSAESLEHCSACEVCGRVLHEIRMVAAAFGRGKFEAPRDVIERAVAIMAPRTGFRLVRSTLSLAGTRKSGVDTFQRVFESGGMQVRVLYSRDGEGWHVMVKSEPPALKLNAAGRAVLPEFDSFEFTVAELSESGFELVFENTTETIPPGSEPLEDGLA